MLKPTLFLAFVFLGVSANSQKDLQTVFRQVGPVDFTKAKFYLIDSIENKGEKKITEDKIMYVATNAAYNNSVWTKRLFGSAVIVSRQYLDSVAEKPVWEVPEYYSFSLPYFSKDKQSFLIYYRNWCGTLCAEYSLRLYKRNGSISNAFLKRFLDRAAATIVFTPLRICRSALCNAYQQPE